MEKVLFSDQINGDDSFRKLFKSIFALFFAGFSLFFFFGASFDPLCKEWRERSWAEVEAEVIRAEIVPPVDSNSDYHFDLKFRYKIDEKEMSGSRIAGYELNGSEDSLSELYSEFKVGRKLTGKVNPASSDFELSLTSKTIPTFLYVMPIIGLLPLCVSLFFVFRPWFNSGPSGERRGNELKLGASIGCPIFIIMGYFSVVAMLKQYPNDIWFGIVFGGLFILAGFSGLFAVFFVGKKKLGRKVKPSKKGNNKIDKFNRRWEKVGNENVLLRSDSYKYVVAMILVVVFVFSLLILYFVGKHTLVENARFPVGYFIATLLAPIVAGGYLLRQFMRIYNLSVKLAVSSDVICAGEDLTLFWKTVTGARRVNEFTITLVGEESASYEVSETGKSGRRTVTVSDIFYEKVLFSTKKTAEVTKGTLSFNFPDSLMHSFTTADNKIAWKIRVTGQMDGWPDFNEKYEFEVLPNALGS